MLKIENTEVMGWEHAIRGMRNPMNSWEKSDSGTCDELCCTDCPHSDLHHHPERYFDNKGNRKNVYPSDFGLEDECRIGLDTYIIGDNDHQLMMNLAHGGPVHAKYRRMIAVYLDITAPLYWWKEFDTYKVGTVANSCSTMHKIHAKEFELSDFSLEHVCQDCQDAFDVSVLHWLNTAREGYLKTHDKAFWWHMIQLLPTSYNQKRTVMLNYEVLVNIYESRRHHKLDEWHTFCDWIESLPYSELIVGTKKDETNNQ